MLRLKQVEYQENEYPDQIHKVPVKANFFYHFIAVTPRCINATPRIDRNDEQKYNP